MLVNPIIRKTARSQIVSVAIAVAVISSACGAAAGQQLRAAPGDSSTSEAQTEAGSFSLDYDTAQHLGRFNAGAGATSIDYDTAQHMRETHVTAP